MDLVGVSGGCVEVRMLSACVEGFLSACVLCGCTVEVISKFIVGSFIVRVLETCFK